MFSYKWSVLSLLLLLSCQSLTNIFKSGPTVSVTQPVTPKRSKEIISNTDTRVDNYDWLKNREDSEVKKHLLNEKAYAEAILSQAAPIKQEIMNEIKARVDIPRESLVSYMGNYEYYNRYQKGMDYPVYYRKAKGKQEEVILDVQKLSQGKEFINVTNVRPSPDHKVLAYSIDLRGRNIFEIKFIDISTGKELPVSIKGVTSQFEWANDNKHVFYIKQDKQTLRWNQLWRFSFKDYKAKLVFEEMDQEYYVYLRKSLNQKTIFITSESTNTSEVSYIDANKADSEPIVIQRRINDVRYFAHDGGDRFYILTNYSASNYKIMKVTKRSGQLGFVYWKSVIDYIESEYTEDIQLYEDFIVAQIRVNGLSQFKVISRTSQLRSHEVKFDEKSYYASLAEPLPYNSASFRYGFESITSPKEDIAYQVFKKEATVVREQIIPYLNSSDYITEVMEVKSHDDKQIPVTIVHHRKTKKTAETPLLLYGYGSYGFTYDAFFNEAILSLLDRGFIFAIAHVRGGSKKGHDWYLNGKMMLKKNTFKDFISVAYDLIGKNYTSPDHLYALGKSAGGLLVGAVVNEKPELFNAVVAEVPFVDVINTMLDSSIPLTTSEYQEWGNPNEAEAYEYIKSYSPYDNIKKQKYPHILATAFWQDSQVQYWEPAKWIAKLREYNTSNSLLVLDMNFDGGHGGNSGRVGRFNQKAKAYSFLVWLEREANK